MKKWSYGVTSVKSRLQSLLPQTLASLKLAGFEKPTLFIDDIDHSIASECSKKFGLIVVNRQPQIKTYGNWLLTLLELYIRDPNADRYAIFQDDITVYKNLRFYLDECEYPKKGYLNIYTFPSNQLLADRQLGWYKSNQLGRGAVGLIFNNQAVVELLQQRSIIVKPKAAEKSTKSVDGAVIHALKSIDYTEYVHNPSLSQHWGIVSSMGNTKQPKSTSFLGNNYDAMNFLSNPVLNEETTNPVSQNLVAACEMLGVDFKRINDWLGEPCNCEERNRKVTQINNWSERVLNQDPRKSRLYLEQILNNYES